MKIGLVTITELDNFGNRLQNYALQKTLLQYADTVETIPNLITYEYRKSKKYQIMELLSGFKHNNRQKIAEILRQLRFEAFDRKYISFSSAYSTIKYISPELDSLYDIFVAGSDQIWNPYFPFNRDFNFLQFTSREKRIAYSASIGVEAIPEKRKEQFTDYFNSIDSISVREFAGQRIIKELTGKDVPVLPDPTLLLTPEEWISIEKKPKWFNSKEYILTYFLGEKQLLSSFIDDIKTKDETYGRYELIDLNNKSLIREYTYRPDEFIWLIHHAKLMITDSFHGTVFSILMSTPFASLSRIDSGVSMNSRIETLYRLLGEKFTENQINTVHIENNEIILEKLDYLRQLAYTYLSENLTK